MSFLCGAHPRLALLDVPRSKFPDHRQPLKVHFALAAPPRWLHELLSQMADANDIDVLFASRIDAFGSSETLPAHLRIHGDGLFSGDENALPPQQLDTIMSRVRCSAQQTFFIFENPSNAPNRKLYVPIKSLLPRIFGRAFNTFSGTAIQYYIVKKKNLSASTASEDWEKSKKLDERR